MARSRNIKPGFFKNDLLGECSLGARLLFIGLWTLADREGRLEDRPKRIKGELFPYDSFDIEPFLKELDGTFILRYAANGAKLVQILTFEKHQNPHYKELPSTLEPPPGWQSSAQKPETFTPSIGGLTGLNPESGFLIPDSLIPDCGGVKDTPAHTHLKTELREAIKAMRPDLDPDPVFQGFRQHYPPEKRTRAKFDKWVKGEKAAAPGTLSSAADPDSRASIESLGLSLGLGKWDEMQEPWTTYRKRIKEFSNA